MCICLRIQRFNFFSQLYLRFAVYVVGRITARLLDIWIQFIPSFMSFPSFTQTMTDLPENII